VVEKHVEHAIGSVARPMSDADLSAKFLELAKPVIGAQAATALDAAWRVDSDAPLAALLTLARPSSRYAA
jgi:hypothetical protein